MRTFSRITKSLVLTALLAGCGQSMDVQAQAENSGPRAEVYTGVLEVAVVDNLDSAYHIVTLRTANGERVRLKLRDEQLEGFRGGDTVDVLGVRGKDEIDLTAGGTLSPATGGDFGTTRSALVPNGPRNTAVVLFNFRNDTTQPITKAKAQSAVYTATDSLNAYYKEISNNAMSIAGITDKINGDAFGYFTIDSDNTDCSSPFTWTDKVDVLAKAQGINLAQYSSVIYIGPDAASCTWAGIGYMPGNKVIIKASMIDAYPKVITHEFGHNLGFAHANVYRCTDGGQAVSLSASCTSQEYGDLLDPMGIATPKLPTSTNVRNKSDAGWMGSRVQTVTQSGEYSFTAANVATNGVQALKIARPDGTFLWLETRSFAGFDARSISSNTHAVYKGVTIRIAKEVGTIQSQLIDANPATDSVDDAPFMPGAALRDPVSNITMTVLSVDNGMARVKVDMTGAPPPPPPSTNPPPPPPKTTDPVVRVTSVYSGLPMSVVGASNADGAPIEQATYTAQASQHMRLQYANGGFMIRPTSTDFCLDISGSAKIAGAQVNQAVCNNGASQRFSLESVNGAYRLRNANSNLCLDISGPLPYPGARIVQQPCSNANSQQWIFYLPN